MTYRDNVRLATRYELERRARAHVVTVLVVLATELVVLGGLAWVWLHK